MMAFSQNFESLDNYCDSVDIEHECPDADSGRVDSRHAFRVIPDSYTTVEEVTEALKKAGLETCSLIFGIDYTSSNMCQGEKTFGGKSLHDISGSVFNPYQRVICILGETLEPFDDDGIIPAFGFGDRKTKDKSVFNLKPGGGDCDGFMEVLDVYKEVTPTVKLGGPTNFAPLIEKAINIVKAKNEYHILVIVADGQVTTEKPTKDALVAASQWPLSVIMIGVGDGPWESMKNFDDGLADRQFDNFQFVNFNEVMSNARNPHAEFALRALMEIPDQYKILKELGLIKNK